MSAAADSGGGVSAADSGGVPGALVELPAVLPPAPRTFGDGAIELRVGRWQEALADVASVDVLITDPPYSERTHAGHDTGTRDANAVAKAVGRRKGDGSLITVARASRRALGYECWTADDVAAFVAAWAPSTRGWFVAITDHVLAPVWESALEAADRYVFAPLQFMAPGSRVRIGGDGPALWSTTIVVARPRNRSFQQWGSLPGGYVLPSGQNATRAVIGGKPLWLMQALIRDYSRPGDLVCDPCAGGATTLLAAAISKAGAALVPRWIPLPTRSRASGSGAATRRTCSRPRVPSARPPHNTTSTSASPPLDRRHPPMETRETPELTVAGTDICATCRHPRSLHKRNNNGHCMAPWLDLIAPPPPGSPPPCGCEVFGEGVPQLVINNELPIGPPDVIDNTLPPEPPPPENVLDNTLPPEPPPPEAVRDVERETERGRDHTPPPLAAPKHHHHVEPPKYVDSKKYKR